MVIALVQPQAKTTSARAEGVRWTTFPALTADLIEDPTLRLVYDQAVLEISSTSQRWNEGTIVLPGIQWQTCKALMEDVGDGRAWCFAYDSGLLEIRMTR
jgi:hypothetical protein